MKKQINTLRKKVITLTKERDFYKKQIEDTKEIVKRIRDANKKATN